MRDPDTYTPKISSEEAREGYILVLKDRLGFFPPPGQPFVLEDSGASLSATVDAVPCTCRGPEKPHEHWRIPLSGLVRGQPVTLHREPGEPPRYRLIGEFAK